LFSHHQEGRERNNNDGQLEEEKEGKDKVDELGEDEDEENRFWIWTKKWRLNLWKARWTRMDNSELDEDEDGKVRLSFYKK